MASRSLGTLTLDLIAKVGGFVTGMDAAARAADRTNRQLKKFGSDLASAFTRATAVAAGALAFFTKQAISTQDELHDLSEVTGISTESLSQLGYAADQSGTSFDSIITGFRKLSSAAADAASGIEAPAKAFDKLKIETTNADKTLKDMDELLLEVADAFSTMADGAAKNALAQDLFGRSGAELIPFLNQGEAGIRALMERFDELGGTVTDASAALADEFNDSLKDLKEISKGVFNQFATAILPMLVQFSDYLVDSSEDMVDAEDSARKLAAGFKFLASIAVALKGAFEALGTMIGGVAAAIGRVADMKLPDTGTGTLTEWVAIRVQALRAGGEISEAFEDAKLNAIDDIEAIEAIWTEAVNNLDKATDELGKPGGGSEVTFVDEAALAEQVKSAEDALAEIQKMQTDLDQQVATFGQGTAAVTAYSIAQGQLAKTFAAAGAAADPYRQSLVDTQQALEDLAEAEKIAAEEFSKQQANQAEIISLDPLLAYEARLAHLDELLAEGLNPEIWQKEADAAAQAFKDATTEVNVFAEQATRNVQDILSKHLKTGFEDGFDGILDSFKQLIIDLTAEALAADIAQALFGGGGVGSGGGLFGFLGELFGGGRAMGGGVVAGTSYLVGERGPEVFTPAMSGSISPNSSAGGVNIVQNNYISGSNLGPEQMTKILDDNNRKLKGEFLGELRRGAYA